MIEMGKKTTWLLVCVIAKIWMKGVIGKNRVFLDADSAGTFENYRVYIRSA